MNKYQKRKSAEIKRIMNDLNSRTFVSDIPGKMILSTAYGNIPFTYKQAKCVWKFLKETGQLYYSGHCLVYQLNNTIYMIPHLRRNELYLKFI